MKKIYLLTFFIPFLNLLSAQNYSTSTIINVDSLKNKSVPFDVPFDLVTKNIPDLKRVYKTSIVLEDTNRVTYDLLFDTLGKTLTIHVFPIKPKKQFTIAVRYELLNEDIQLFINLTKELSESKNDDANNTFSEIYHRFNYTTTNLSRIIRFIKYNDANSFSKTNEYKLIKTYLESSQNNYNKLSPIILNQVENLATATKINFDKLTSFRLAEANYLDDISSGTNDITNITSNSNKCGKVDLFQRIQNLNSSIASTQKLIDSMQVILTQSPNPDANVIVTTLLNDLKQLNSSKQILSKCIKDISTVLNKVIAGGSVYTGLSRALDIDTKTASLTSLDLGISTILVKDVNKQYQTIPRLFIGVDFYFRPVDRNVGSFYAVSRKDTAYKGNTLVTRKSIFYNLNLSLALTVGGSINTPGFSNLITNNFSVQLGPSFRFLQAFRLSAGVALLNRNNQNPLIENSKLYVGAYSALSVDLAFAKASKIVTDLIYKY